MNVSVPGTAPLDSLVDAAILTEDECVRVVAAAEASAAWSRRGDYHGHVTTDLDALQLAELQPWLLQSVVRERAQPLLERTFGVGALELTALRVVKYVAGTGCDGLPLHSDGGIVSFVCALNACVAGGGTYVRALRRIVAPAVGHALLFCGRWMHQGVPVVGSGGDGGAAVRYVLTGFFAATQPLPPATQAALDRLLEHEQQATVSRRLCPTRRQWLRREFCRGGGSAGKLQPRACSGCDASIGAYEARHCCDCGCATRWCDGCLEAAALAADGTTSPSTSASAAPEAAGSRRRRMMCELLEDVTMADGSEVVAGAVVRKVWRLSQALGSGGAPWPLGGSGGGGGGGTVRLVRADVDTDESIGSRCLGDAALTLVGGGDGNDGGSAIASSLAATDLVDAAVEIVAPRHPGRFRVFFRLVSGGEGEARPLEGCNELYCDFVVVVQGAEAADEPVLMARVRP